MSRAEDAERLVARLTPAELGDFRRWFTGLDAAASDRQFAADVADGKLDAPADRSLASHAAGRTTKI